MRTPIFLLFTAALTFALGPNGLGQTPGLDEIAIGPVVTTQPIQGVQVVLPVTAFLKLSTKGGGVSVDLRVVANLSDPQQHKSGSIWVILGYLGLPGLSPGVIVNT